VSGVSWENQSGVSTHTLADRYGTVMGPEIKGAKSGSDFSPQAVLMHLTLHGDRYRYVYPAVMGRSIQFSRQLIRGVYLNAAVVGCDTCIHGI